MRRFIDQEAFGVVVECCSQASSRPGSGEGAEYGWYRDHQCFLSFADQFGCPVSKPLRPHHSITSFFSTPLICVPSRSNRLIMPATAIHMGHSVDHNAPVAPLLALFLFGRLTPGPRSMPSFCWSSRHPLTYAYRSLWSSRRSGPHSTTIPNWSHYHTIA